MPSLLNSEGAGHGLPDGIVEVWDNKISGMTFVNLSRSAPPAAAEWCQNVGVIADEAGVAVEAIKAVVAGQRPHHFTLPLVELKSMSLAGYVHARYAPKQEELSISHVKVNERHMNRGCGKLLLAAAEEHSHRLGWKCNQTYLSVLKANERARRCYTKAGFKFESSRSASWGKKEHSGSEWQRWKKVHKHSIYDKKAPVAQ
ncbi:unnamed protein product [Cladocopium goreaui]|uniref:Spermine/spermidine N(1)-acetyltransferase n=1 Tax=Cladocopium goreaui TaxID=2562237 RepID=A0A9P1FIP3_9DINO|nr:unnamed protein product [Cladocopium goreaui]